MRAQFVRGEDPKKSLQIGDEATYQKIADQMKADGWTPEDPHESDSAIGWAVEYGHHDIAKFLLDRHGDLPEVRSNMPDFVQWSAQNRDLNMLDLLLSYKPHFSNQAQRWTLKMATSYEPAYIKIKKYLEIDESQNFERGIEPKKAMNIGKDRHIKKGDRFFVKNYYDGKMYEVTAFSDETTEWGADGEPEDIVEIRFDNYDSYRVAYKEEDGTWMLSDG